MNTKLQGLQILGTIETDAIFIILHSSLAMISPDPEGHN